MAAGETDRTVDERARRQLRDGALGGLLLVALMNVAGISLTLFVSVTDHSSDAGVFPAMFASIQGAVHVILGFALLIGGIFLIFPARKCADRRFLPLTLIALASLSVAGYAGYHFVLSGENTYSFVMEMGFLGVVLSQALILAFLIAPPGPPRPRGEIPTALPIPVPRTVPAPPDA
ncbi:MAG TPA: hypothetical protein VGP88_08145 [Thermoplasmata archaeon]|nr:hypothetical protein [Thermoplasmata archaeon]